MTAPPRLKTMLGPGHKEHRVADGLAWLLNVLSSVLIVFVNKVLMDSRSGYKFVFATTLCSLHFFASGLAVKASEALGYSTPAHLPFADTLVFSTVAGVSIASLNLSLLLNSVGFYQISKLLIIPFVCLIEALWMRRQFKGVVLASVITVVAGVGIVTVSDMSVNNLTFGGLVIAMVSVVTSGMQQVLCGQIQRRHSMTSTQLLSNTAPVQGLLLLVVGPYLDLLISKHWILSYQASVPALVCLAVSCAVAILVNISQFMCLGRFSAVTFQVLGHTKTVLVLLVGWLYLNDSMTSRKLLGAALAIAGMVAYGYFTSIASGGATGGPSTPSQAAAPAAARSPSTAMMDGEAASIAVTGMAASASVASKRGNVQQFMAEQEPLLGVRRDTGDARKTATLMHPH